MTVQGASASGLAAGTEDYCLDWLVEEVSTSINTAAAGGNASLMAIGSRAANTQVITTVLWRFSNSRCSARVG